MTIQKIIFVIAAWFVIKTLARCAIDEFRLSRYFRKFKKGGFL